MPQLFISHSSADNADAIALRDWLAGQGWADIFLDVDPSRGIAAGERWERALNQAAVRCEAVLFLVSRHWLSSGWCLKEFNLAHRLSKQLFGILVEDIPVAELPVNLTSAWQVVSLAAGQDHEPFTVSLPITGEERLVTFSREGLSRLRTGLRRAGLDPTVFAWPPPDDPERPPYPGLRPLEAEDAGIFFGREASIIESLDRLRALREGAAPRLLCLLGSSGSGKSSFLRAGLWPRLARDDCHFLPLPVLRPERAALSGTSGLLSVLLAGCAAHGVPTSRGDLRSGIEAGADGVRPILRALQANAASGFVEDGTPSRSPLLILPIDQAEELHGGEAGAESAALLRLLLDLLLEDDPNLAVLMTIRSDAFERFQLAPALEGLPIQTVTFSPMPRGVYATLIEGPAARLTNANRPLTIEPALTRALLADLDEGGGRDALPLLAFTMERLWLEYGGRGRLTLDDYEKLGRVRGSIEAAVERALAAAELDPRIPKDPAARLLLLRHGLIPWLAGIDPETSAPRRRVARRSEIPQEALPLVDLLVEQRLLSTDLDPTTSEATVEPAHEALLRQWGILQGWLEADFAALATLDGVRRATRDWTANALSTAWLAHGGSRLSEAEKLTERPDLSALLDGAERAYLQACRERADSDAARERQRAGQRRVLHWGSVAAAIVFAVLGLLAGWQASVARDQTALAGQQTALARDRATEAELAKADADLQKAAAEAQAAVAEGEKSRADATARSALEERRRSQRSESAALADQSLRETGAGDTSAGMHLALAGLPRDLAEPDRPFTARAHYALARAVAEHRLANVLRPSTEQVNHAVFSPDGSALATSSRDGLVTIWDVRSAKARSRFDDGRGAALKSTFSRDGTQLATTFENPPSIVVRDIVSGTVRQDLRIQRGTLVGGDVAFSPDGRKLLTVGGLTDGDVRVWDLEAERQVATFSMTRGLDFNRGLGFSPDGQQAWLLTSEGFRIWDLGTGRTFLSDVEPDNAPLDNASHFRSQEDREKTAGLAYLPEEARLILRRSTMLHAVSLPERRVEKSWRYADEGSMAHLAEGLLVAPPGDDIVVPVGQTELAIFDLVLGKNTVAFRGHTTPITASVRSPDGRLVAALAEGGTVRVWDVRSGYQRNLFRIPEGSGGRLEFSAGSDLLMSYAGSAVRLWHVGDRSEADRTPGLDAKWSVLAVSSSGDRALVGVRTTTYDGPTELGIFDLAAGRHVARLPAMPSWKADIDSATFSPSGRLLLLPRLRKDLLGAAAEAASLLATEGPLPRPMDPAEFGERGFIEVRDTGSGKLVGVVVPGAAGHRKASFSLDETSVCFGEGDTSEKRSRVDVFRLPSGESRWSRVLDGVTEVTFTFEGEVLELVARRDGRGSSFERLHVVSGRRLSTYEAPDVEGLTMTRVDAGRGVLLSSRHTAPQLLASETGAPVAGFSSPLAGVDSFDVSGNAGTVVIRRTDKSAALWSLATRTRLAPLGVDTVSDVVAWSGDRRRLLTRAWRAKETILLVHDAVTGALLKELKHDGTNYVGADLSQTGAFLVLWPAADGSLEIHDAGEALPPRRIRPEAGLESYAFASRDERLVTVGKAGAIEVWNTSTGDRLARHEGGREGRPLGARINTSRHLAIRWQGGGAVALDASTGRAVWRSGDPGIVDLAVSADDRHLLVVHPERIETFVIDGLARTGTYRFDSRQLTSLEPSPTGDAAMVFSRGGRSLLLGLTSGLRLAELDGVNVFSFEPNGSWLAVGRAAGVEVLDVSTGRPRHAVRTDTAVNEIRTATSGAAALAATKGGSVLVLDASSGLASTVGMFRREVKKVAFGNHAQEVLVHEQGGLLGLWRVGEPAPITVFLQADWSSEKASPFWRVKASPSAATIVVCTPDNFLRSFNANDGRQFNWHFWVDTGCVDLVVLDDKTAVVLIENGTLLQLNIRESRVLRSFAIPGKFSRYDKGAISQRGTRLVVTSADGIVTTVSTTIDDVQTFRTDTRSEGMLAALSSDGALLATIDQSALLRVWDTAARAIVAERRISDPGSRMYDLTLRFSADDRRIIVEKNRDLPEITPAPALRSALLTRARALVGDAPDTSTSEPTGSRLRLGVVSTRVSAARADAQGLPAAEGALLLEVLADSPAYQAGLAPGDIVVRFNGMPILDNTGLTAAVASVKPGSSVVVDAVRDRARLSMSVQL